MNRGDSASPYSVRRSRRPQARLAASYTRTGRPRRHLPSNQAAGRRAKAKGHTARMYVHEESHSGILPMNQSNKDRKPSAENEEERPLIKENAGQPNTHPTQSGKRVSQGLAGVRKAARDNKEMKFTALLHHLTVDLLRESFYALKRKAAPGVDGTRWQEYATGLEGRLVDLHNRVHRGAYQVKPSRRVYIEKADGRQRPLGVAALEDKIVQQAVATILNQIYEEDFLGFSYGFRPGRSQHQALDALSVALTERKVNYVLDADIRGFFDHLDHGWMLKFVQHRVADPRIVRLIQKWLKAGVMEEGKWKETEMGTPQGALVSPLLANIYLHYVLDLWVQAWRKKHAHGDVIVVRYADDAVLGFQRRDEAERFLDQLRERMAKFGLELHPEKTRLMEFGPFAINNRQKRGEGKPETFNFLGFTHICVKKRSNGMYTVLRQTIRKRLQAKLNEVKADLQRRMHAPIPEQGKWLRAVVGGHIRYYGVPMNQPARTTFRFRVGWLWHRSLSRRSQNGRVLWDRMRRLITRWLPLPSVCHPYPLRRLGVVT